MSESVAVPKMKTIGILGGMGPQATINVEQRIHRVAQQFIPQDVSRGYPPMIVAYHRGAPMMLDEDGEVVDPLRPDQALLDLASSIGPLVDFLIVPCNTAHFFVEQLEEAAGCRILSIVDVTVKEVGRRGLSEVLLLAVGETLKRGLYQKRLEEIGVQCEVPSDDDITRLDGAIWKVMEGDDPENLHWPIMDCLLPSKTSVEEVILGCTELPLCRFSLYKLGKQAINPNQLLAEAAVKYALEP